MEVIVAFKDRSEPFDVVYDDVKEWRVVEGVLHLKLEGGESIVIPLSSFESAETRGMGVGSDSSSS